VELDDNRSDYLRVNEGQLEKEEEVKEYTIYLCVG
jgi:hypothetical protein